MRAVKAKTIRRQTIAQHGAIIFTMAVGGKSRKRTAANPGPVGADTVHGNLYRKAKKAAR